MGLAQNYEFKFKRIRAAIVLDLSPLFIGPQTNGFGAKHGKYTWYAHHRSSTAQIRVNRLTVWSQNSSWQLVAHQVQQKSKLAAMHGMNFE